jgi:TolB protein
MVVWRSEIWIASPDDHRICRISLTGSPHQLVPIEVSGRPSLLAAGETALWAADPTKGVLWKIAPNGEALLSVELHGRISGIAATRERVWVATADDRDLQFAGRIVFGRNGRIVITQADGKLRRVTRGPRDSMPDLSSDGRRVVFVRGRGDSRDLWVVRANGTGEGRLAPLSGRQTAPSWSPDGRTIAFATVEPPDPELWTIDAGGGNLRRLTDDDAWQGSPTWSPDGSRIAFLSNADDPGGGSKVHVIGADGQGELPVSRRPSGPPAWSPEGASIAYWTDQFGGSVQLVNPLDPTSPEPLLPLEAPGKGTLYPDASVTWSPDGRFLVVAFGDAPRQHLVVARSDGTAGHVLVTAEAVGSPDWAIRS